MKLGAGAKKVGISCFESSNDQRIDLRRKHKICKYLCSQHRSTSIHKASSNTHKREVGSNTVVLGDFNSPLTPMDRSLKQKIKKETQTLNDTLEQVDLIDMFRTFYPNAEYIFFSSAHGTFSRIDLILGHRSSLSKYKKIEVVPRISSNHNSMKLDINYKKKQ